MKTLFYSVLALHLIFFTACSYSSNATFTQKSDDSIKLQEDTNNIITTDYHGHWGWRNSGEAAISMKIFSDKDSVGYYIYTYYFGNRIEMGYVKLVSQEGYNGVFLVGDDNANRPWSAKFNATMLTDTSFFLTRQDHEDYRLEDSIIMTSCHSDQELELGRWIIEDYKRMHPN